MFVACHFVCKELTWLRSQVCWIRSDLFHCQCDFLVNACPNDVWAEFCLKESKGFLLINGTHLTIRKGVPIATQAKMARRHEGLQLSCPHGLERDFSRSFLYTVHQARSYCYSINYQGLGKTKKPNWWCYWNVCNALLLFWRKLCCSYSWNEIPNKYQTSCNIRIKRNGWN